MSQKLPQELSAFKKLTALAAQALAGKYADALF
jgi:hypothetical protein